MSLLHIIIMGSVIKSLKIAAILFNINDKSKISFAFI